MYYLLFQTFSSTFSTVFIKSSFVTFEIDKVFAFAHVKDPLIIVVNSPRPMEAAQGRCTK